MAVLGISDYKPCTRCKQEKHKSQYSLNKACSDGICYVCKECARDFTRKRRQENPEKCRLETNKSKQKNKHKYEKKTWASSLRKNYGITTEKYEELSIIQSGYCLICKKHSTELKRRLVVDHDHDTGVIRGLLCHTCNSAIGFLQDSVEVIESALNYLKKSQTKVTE